MQSLKTLHLENTLMIRGILWKHLEHMAHLRILNIYTNSIKVLSNEFVQYAPKNLEQISFYDTKTKKYVQLMSLLTFQSWIK